VNSSDRPNAAAAAPASGFDPRALLQFVLGYKWLVLGVAALVTTGTVFWTLRQPNVYQATCTLEYDPLPPRPLGSQVQDVASPGTNYWLSREFFETQNRVLASRSVAERVVARLALHHDPDFAGVPQGQRAGWRGVSVEAAAQMVQGRLTIQPVEETRLVHVHVRDGDPETAQALANAVADSYIEKTLQDRAGTTGSALEWLSEQLDTLRTELESSELALHEFKRDHNVLSLSMEDRQNLVASDIQRLSEALGGVRTRRIELAARVAQLRRANGEDPMEVHATVIRESTTINELRAGYRSKMLERERLGERYGPGHPAIVALDGEIRVLRDSVRQEINGLITAAASDLAEVSAVEGGLKDALEQANAAGLDLNLREIEYQRLNRERANNSRLYDLLLQRTAETDLTRMLNVTFVRVVDRALRPTEAVSPDHRRNAVSGLVGGVVAGLVVAFALSRLDRRVRNADDVEALGTTVLGILPRIDEATVERRKQAKRDPQDGAKVSLARDFFAHHHPMSPVAECLRTIRTNLAFMSADEPPRVITVTSASPQEGKSTMAINLAVSLAESGKRTLLIDTDMRRPRVHRAFGVPNMKGATSVLVHEADLKQAVVATEVPGLDILPCGPIPPNPAELLHTARFRELLERSAASYDRVVLDSPPIGVVTDAAVIGPQTNGVILVVRAGSTSRDAVSSVLRQLRDVNATIIGCVLNDVNLKARDYGSRYSYSYYYGNDGYSESSAISAAERGTDEKRPAA
jgi:succinoglycan biosynthesis transport protein ExoP